MNNEIALEIISKFNINTKIPYSYDGTDYLSAEDVLAKILQKVEHPHVTTRYEDILPLKFVGRFIGG